MSHLNCKLHIYNYELYIFTEIFSKYGCLLKCRIYPENVYMYHVYILLKDVVVDVGFMIIKKRKNEHKKKLQKKRKKQNR